MGNATSMPTRHSSSDVACETSSQRDEVRRGPEDVSPGKRREIDNAGARGRYTQRSFHVAISCLSPPYRRFPPRLASSASSVWTCADHATTSYRGPRAEVAPKPEPDVGTRP